MAFIDAFTKWASENPQALADAIQRDADVMQRHAAAVEEDNRRVEAQRREDGIDWFSVFIMWTSDDPLVIIDRYALLERKEAEMDEREATSEFDPDEINQAYGRVVVMDPLPSEEVRERRRAARLQIHEDRVLEGCTLFGDSE